MNLTTEDARDRFATAVLAHLATADERSQPHVVATTFAAERDQIVMAVDHKPKTTPNLKRLRNITANPKVTVLVDHYEDDWSRLWWVRADGTARVVDDAQECEEPIRSLQAKYQQYQDHRPDGPVILITVSRWLGWSGEA
ncbi:MAG: TIGR03668 family PPOX class F420-dependent oxidoreductase [Egibacteraceae bacterium]